LIGPSLGGGEDGRPVTVDQVRASTSYHNIITLNNNTDERLYQATDYMYTTAEGHTELEIAGSGNPVVQVEFTAHYDKNLNNAITSEPFLELDVGNLVHFTLSPGLGLIADEPGRGIVGFDQDFDMRTNSDFSYVGVFGLAPGSQIDLSWLSSLDSYANDNMEPGQSTSDSHYTWNLTLTVGDP
jgi:hypothetical protein